MKALGKERKKMTKIEWSKAIYKILRNEPFDWPSASAREYSVAMREGYYEDGYAPEDAIYEDITYWG